MTKKITLSKIPYVFKNVALPNTVEISDAIEAEEGSCIAVQAGKHNGKLNVLDMTNGRLGWLWEKDIIPSILGYRKATTEFAGTIPKEVAVGDMLYFLCESGIVGAIEGIFPSWGEPMTVKVLGAITDASGKQMNLHQYTLSNGEILSNKAQIPLIIFLSTRMDSGKTTMACKIVHALRKFGKKTAGVKLTGVAFSQDMMKLKDSGADPVYDFVDMGLPSTCGNSNEKIVHAALRIVEKAKKSHPDCIVVEFGDGILGEYHVADVLQNNAFSSQISFVILAANDFAGIKGTQDILSRWGIDIDLVTGPIANSAIGTSLIYKYFHLPSESNAGEIPKTIRHIRKKLFSKTDNSIQCSAGHEFRQ